MRQKQFKTTAYTYTYLFSRPRNKHDFQDRMTEKWTNWDKHSKKDEDEDEGECLNKHTNKQEGKRKMPQESLTVKRWSKKKEDMIDMYKKKRKRDKKKQKRSEKKKKERHF